MQVAQDNDSSQYSSTEFSHLTTSNKIIKNCYNHTKGSDLMKKITITLPEENQQSALKLTQMVVKELKKHGMHQKAKELSQYVTGQTSINDVIKITSHYVNWKKERIY